MGDAYLYVKVKDVVYLAVHNIHARHLSSRDLGQTR